MNNIGLPQWDCGLAAMRRRGAGRILGFVALCFCAMPAVLKAQANVLQNGGFEGIANYQNLYDGVDASGYVRVPLCNGPIYLEGGSFNHLPFATSVDFADVNGDGLPDLIVASPLGFLYWFPNIGKKGAPAFDHGNMVSTFLGTAPRIHAVDFNGDGKVDILFGNIDGNIYFLPNVGSTNEPKWVSEMSKPQWFPPALPIYYPDPIPGYEVNKVKDDKAPINVGNYSAPVYADWNKDGIPDLIVGEGSYSANSVRVWINQGSTGNPSFRDEAKFFAAFGDGREQLTPTVYDWNGDGIPDLLVGDREGRVALHLGSAEAIKNAKDIKPVPLTKFLAIGGRERLGGLVSIHACDWNEDGIPDLLYGTANGMVYIALGKGKREDPELEAGIPIQGKDFAKDFNQPSNWVNEHLDTTTTFYGNSVPMPYFGSAPLPEVVSKEQVPDLEVKEGQRVFHLSYFNKFCGFYYTLPSTAGVPQGFNRGFYSMTQVFSFNLGRKYELSFWKKGSGITIHPNIYYSQDVHAVDAKGLPIAPGHAEYDSVTVGSMWTQYKKSFLLPNKDPNKKLDGTAYRAKFTMSFYGDGEVWLDDVKLIEVAK